MANTPSQPSALLAGILFCPPYANTAARLVAGPDVHRFNHLFDATTDMLMQICRDIRLRSYENKESMVALPAEILADLMMGLALQMSLIASHLADCNGWKTNSIREILFNTEMLPPPLKTVFHPDLQFWKCLLGHNGAPNLLDAFKSLDEINQIRCVAILTSGLRPEVQIDHFIAAPDKIAYLAERLRQAGIETFKGHIDDVSRLKQAIAWSIAAGADHPTVALNQ